MTISLRIRQFVLITTMLLGTAGHASARNACPGLFPRVGLAVDRFLDAYKREYRAMPSLSRYEQMHSGESDLAGEYGREQLIARNLIERHFLALMKFLEVLEKDELAEDYPSEWRAGLDCARRYLTSSLQEMTEPTHFDLRPEQLLSRIEPRAKARALQGPTSIDSAEAGR